MLYSTVNLIAQAISSDLCIFCFFNLIILMIFVGSKHNQDSSEHNQDSEILPSDPANDRQDIEVDQHSLVSSTEEGTNACTVVLFMYEPAASEGRKQGEDDHIDDMNSDTDDKDENYAEESIDELTKRVEEFIDKFNRERRAEMLQDIELSLETQ
ncbi:hypothetical protein DITRI_Ditri04bG0192500 [Diplodiscus trichospermus]